MYSNGGITHYSGHFDEFIVIQLSVIVDIGFGPKFQKLRFRQFFTQGGGDGFQFFGFDVSITIFVEDFESFFQGLF